MLMAMPSTVCVYPLLLFTFSLCPMQTAHQSCGSDTDALDLSTEYEEDLVEKLQADKHDIDRYCIAPVRRI